MRTQRQPHKQQSILDRSSHRLAAFKLDLPSPASLYSAHRSSPIQPMMLSCTRPLTERRMFFAPVTVRTSLLQRFRILRRAGIRVMTDLEALRDLLTQAQRVVTRLTMNKALSRQANGPNTGIKRQSRD